MIQLSSISAYEAIERRLPECCRPVYKLIFESEQAICIGEIGEALKMQNSTVSGRVNDLIESKLVYYVLKADGKRFSRRSEVSGKMVNVLRANDVFTVDPEQIKIKSPVKNPERVDAGGLSTPDRFKTQGHLFPDNNQSNAA